MGVAENGDILFLNHTTSIVYCRTSLRGRHMLTLRI
jgi:hypothetical protein